MDEAKIKRNIRVIRKAGRSLDAVLPEIPEAARGAFSRIWAEVEAEKTRRAPSYREGVEYVAMNDEPTHLEVETVQYMPTVQLMAILFGKRVDEVAADVVAFRKKHIRG
jgi:hypothetical protein